MRRFLLLFSVFSATFFLNSCKSFSLTGVNAVAVAESSVKNLYFSSKETDYVYKGKIEIYGNNISGLLILKKITDTDHRMVMTTDFGNKLLDFEISDTNFKINYVTPDMDREMVKKFLEKDFRILLKENFEVSQQHESMLEKIYTSQKDKESFYLFFNKETGILQKMIYTENGKEKINFKFEGKTAIFADRIELIHQDIKLKITLNAIND